MRLAPRLRSPPRAAEWRLPPALAPREPSEYTRFLIAIAVMEHQLDVWREKRDSGGSLKWLPQIEGYEREHPIRPLHDLLAHCPDDVADETEAGLLFIADADDRALLRRDIAAAERTFNQSEFKAATVLAGSVVEALLILRIELVEGGRVVEAAAKNDLRGRDRTQILDRADLAGLIRLAKELELFQPRVPGVGSPDPWCPARCCHAAPRRARAQGPDRRCSGWSLQGPATGACDGPDARGGASRGARGARSMVQLRHRAQVSSRGGASPRAWPHDRGRAALRAGSAGPRAQARHCEQRARDIERRRRARRVGEWLSPWVFHAGRRRRGHVSKDSVERNWKRAATAAGFPGIVPHDLRRSGIRNLVRGGGTPARGGVDQRAQVDHHLHEVQHRIRRRPVGGLPKGRCLRGQADKTRTRDGGRSVSSDNLAESWRRPASPGHGVWVR